MLLRVPELWRYIRKCFQINLLEGERYLESKTSPNFPDIPIVELIALRQSIVEGRYQHELDIVDQLEGMSKQAILRNIESFLVQRASYRNSVVFNCSEL